MSPRAAKALIADELVRLGLPKYKLTARTISFGDLARDSCLFVKIHNWQPHSSWAQLYALAHDKGFRIED